MTLPIPISHSMEVGNLGVLHLKRLWSTTIRSLAGHGTAEALQDDWAYNVILVDGLGLGLHPTLRYLYRNQPTYEQFETWIVEMNGGDLEPSVIDRVNTALRRAIAPALHQREVAKWSSEPVLSADDLAFWDEHGYVVVSNAISPDQCYASEQAIWDFLEADPTQPATWYNPKKKSGIWVPLYRHPVLDANRQSERIWQAFAQLYETDQLSCSIDQVGFNPPEHADWEFPGPFLHWDTSLELPIPLGLQGILYLTDTAAEQGAFTCVPGFHQRIESWLDQLPPDANPRTQDLYALGAEPIAGKAGDLIIWHHALPHGSRPNRHSRPRIVQYITLYPIDRLASRPWI